MAMEVKRVDQDWYRKCDIWENEVWYGEELLAVDKTLTECDNILSEIGLQTGYSGYGNKIYEIAEKRQHLWDFVLALPEYMEAYLDEPLRQKLNHGACVTISRIHMADFHVENTLGVQVQVDTRGYAAPTFSKDKLTLMDFLGNAVGESAKTCVPNLKGRICECVEEFAVIFQRQYDDMAAQGKLGEYPLNLESYLNQIVSQGEYSHKEDHPLHEVLWSNFLDLFIIKPLIESCCGYNLVTKEDLTEMERSMNAVGAIVDTITLVTGIYGFATAAKEMGWKKAAAYFGNLAMVELAADASATVVASLGEYYEWPAGVTLLLSLGTGITVGQVGNHLIFKRNGIEIFRREIPEGKRFWDDIPSNANPRDILAKINAEKISLHELIPNEQMRIAQELKLRSPVPIPEDVVPVIRYNGYDQIIYKWDDGSYVYEVRWHTSTPNAPEGTPPNWRVDRRIPGIAGGKDPITGIKIQGSPSIREVLIAPPDGQAYYISRDVWNAATEAYSNGTATDIQKEILKWGHIITE